jgi:purine nucleoside phosphorylase
MSSNQTIDTPFGMPSAPITEGEIDGRPVFFLPRHGANHEIPRTGSTTAQTCRIRQLGVDRIFSIERSAVCIRMEPRHHRCSDQIIDMTVGARAGTFFDSGQVMHVDFSEPYCSGLRTTVIRAASETHEIVIDRGTYVCTNGPRLESAAEIRY